MGNSVIGNSKDERKFDGRANFPADDDIEALLDAHFEKYGITKQEICRNFQIYTRRIFLKRFLAHYECFRMTVDLPGDIVELGVYRGASLMSWANFLEIRNMGDRQKQVFGFDNFQGITSLDEKDGKQDSLVSKQMGGYAAGILRKSWKMQSPSSIKTASSPTNLESFWSRVTSRKLCPVSLRKSPAFVSLYCTLIATPTGRLKLALKYYGRVLYPVALCSSTNMVSDLGKVKAERLMNTLKAKR